MNTQAQLKKHPVPTKKSSTVERKGTPQPQGAIQCAATCLMISLRHVTEKQAQLNNPVPTKKISTVERKGTTQPQGAIQCAAMCLMSSLRHVTETQAQLNIHPVPVIKASNFERKGTNQLNTSPAKPHSKRGN
jgi:uncharacterized membrane protein